MNVLRPCIYITKRLALSNFNDKGLGPCSLGCMKLLWTLLILTYSVSSVAGAITSTLSGRILFENNQIYLVKPKQTYHLKFDKIYDLQMIMKLKDSDYISVVGSTSVSKKVFKGQNLINVEVKELNYVGLSDLLGYWLDSNSGMCYYFSTHTKLHVYLPTAEVPCNSRSTRNPNKQNLVTFRYFTIPDDTKNWNMALSSDTYELGADIEEVDKDAAKIIFFEAINGKKINEALLVRPPAVERAK